MAIKFENSTQSASVEKEPRNDLIRQVKPKTPSHPSGTVSFASLEVFEQFPIVCHPASILL